MHNTTAYDLDADFVLCQDCGATSEYSEDKHRGRIKCSCGGDFCGCACCSGVARLSRQFAFDESPSESLDGLPARYSEGETG